MNNKSLIIANWKCNPVTFKEAEHLFNSVKKGVEKIENAEVVICPAVCWLSFFSELAQVKLGGQDCFWEDKGAYTGEISPLMLKNLGCEYVIIGHSERRKYFQETDDVINKKIKAALKVRLRPVLCVGEEIRDTFNSEGMPTNEMSLIVGEQLKNDLIDISIQRIRDIVIAYEPIWAIGTGNPCSPDDAMRAMLFIRKTLTKFYNRNAAEKVRILYGGSVTSQNAIDYVKGANMDGLLVGGASLNASEFVKIVESVSRATLKQ